MGEHESGSGDGRPRVTERDLAVWGNKRTVSRAEPVRKTPAWLPLLVAFLAGLGLSLGLWAALKPAADVTEEEAHSVNPGNSDPVQSTEAVAVRQQHSPAPEASESGAPAVDDGEHMASGRGQRGSASANSPPGASGEPELRARDAAAGQPQPGELVTRDGDSANNDRQGSEGESLSVAGQGQLSATIGHTPSGLWQDDVPQSAGPKAKAMPPKETRRTR